MLSYLVLQTLTLLNTLLFLLAKKTLSGKWLPCLGISWISDANIIGQQEVPV
jgi:hypothetical protein